MSFSSLRMKFVKTIYGDHNSSINVKRALKKCLSKLGTEEFGLNVGAGLTNVDERIRNLDIFPGQHIFYVAKAESIPEKDNFFALVITQEVLEHVQDPFKAISEIYRVMKPGGILYCQLPFIIGYHPGPTDYWRFTKEGISELITRTGFSIIEINISVGTASGFYRIFVEFLAILISIPLPFLYIPFKAFFSLLFYPIKLLDFLFKFSKQKDRIPGGYYIIAQK